MTNQLIKVMSLLILIECGLNQILLLGCAGEVPVKKSHGEIWVYEFKKFFSCLIPATGE